MAKAIKMPSTIVLGPRQIRLLTGGSDFPDENYAHFDPSHGGEIVLHPNVKTPADRGESVLHEYAHASFHYRGIVIPKRLEEQIAQALGMDLLELIVRNPDLIRWIQKGCP